MPSLTPERKIEIKKLIEDKNLYGKDVSEIGSEYNIAFLELDFTSFFETEKPEFQEACGAILYTPKQFYILINQKISSTKKRFTSAHELGHFFLHEEFLKKTRLYAELGSTYLFNRTGGWDGLYDSLDTDAVTREMEANEFAAELLMPEKEVRFEFKKLKSDGTMEVTEEMARIFEVSLLAMTYRLINLGLKSNG